MKKTNRLFAFIAAVCMLAVALPMRAGDDSTPEFYITIKMDQADIYEREPVPVVVVLRTTVDPADFAFVKPKGEITLKKGEFDTLQKVTPAGEPYQETVGGRHFYCIPLNAYMITMAEKGKYELQCEPYQLGVYFYGMATNQLGQRVKSKKLRQFNIEVESKKFKVKSLPAPPQAMDFSGSVGNFTLETIVPPGDIFINEEATAYIVLKGSGMIAESTLPEYRNAFQNGVKLKSVSESRDEGHIRGRMMSQLQLDCTFIPTDLNNAEIGEVSFNYFDPEKGRYTTARSKPVKVNVKSSTAKRENITI